MLSVAQRMNKYRASILRLDLSFNVLPQIVEKQEMIAFELLLIDPHVLSMILL